jgi:ubiquitin-like protein 4
MAELSFAKSFLSSLDNRPIKIPSDYVVDPETTPLRGSVCALFTRPTVYAAPTRLMGPPTNTEQYTLPRLSHPPHPLMPKKRKVSDTDADAAAAAPGGSITNPGASKSVTALLKSARNPVLEVRLTNIPIATTNVLDLREAVQQRITLPDQESPVPLDKIKILYRKKPVSGSPEKTVAEIIRDHEDPDAAEAILRGGKTVEFGVMILGGAAVRPAEETPVAAKTAQRTSSSDVLRSETFWRDLQGFLEQKTKDPTEASKLTGLFKKAWEAST